MFCGYSSMASKPSNAQYFSPGALSMRSRLSKTTAQRKIQVLTCLRFPAAWRWALLWRLTGANGGSSFHIFAQRQSDEDQGIGEVGGQFTEGDELSR